MAKIIDISVTLKYQMPVWPDSAGFKLIPEWRMEDGKPANVSSMNTDLHIGTHVDAPWHFIQGGKTVDLLDLNVLVGEAYVVELTSIDKITASDLEKAKIPKKAERLLIKTSNSCFLWQNPLFEEDFVALTADAAKWLVDRQIKLVGIDYLSIQRYHDDSNLTHEILLNSEVVILEGLNLNGVASGMYNLICLPLKIQGADGAPARAILEVVE